MLARFTILHAFLYFYKRFICEMCWSEYGWEKGEKQLSANKQYKASKHQLTVDGPDGDSTWKEKKKRLKAIQHYEIKMPIYIDNLIFFFCFLLH